MKYGFIHIIIGTLLISVVSVSCRVSRNSEKTETIREASERIEHSVDSSRENSIETELGNLRIDESDEYYLRITEFDVDGAIRRIQEQWRNRRSTNVADWNRQQESVSLSGSEKKVIEKDSSYTAIQETKHVQSDSRPVQGFEWFWIVLVSGILLAIAIYFIIKKKK